MRRHRERAGGGIFAIAVVFALLLPASALAAPVNDDFGNATKIFGAEFTASGSNAGATKQSGEPDHAGNAGGHSVWFRWTAPGNGMYRIDSCGSSFDTLLAVYTGSAVNGLTEVTSNDNGSHCSPRSEVSFAATQGTAYEIAVDGKGGAIGNVLLTFHARPPDDEFSAPRELIGVEDAATGLNDFLATKQNGEPDHAGNAGGHSVWFRWIAPNSGEALVTTCGSDFDTVLGIYTGATVNTLTPVASDDDGTECGAQSEVVFPAIAGTVYKIAVDGKDGATGNVELSVTGTESNDDFKEAATLPASGTSLTPANNLFATEQTGEPEHAGQPGGHSLWYAFKPTAENSTLVLDDCDATFDSLLAVYKYFPIPETKPEFATLVPLASNDDYCGTGSGLTFNAPREENVMVPGEPKPVSLPVTYYIAVDGKNGAVGRFDLSMRPRASNERFANWINIALGQGVEGSNRFGPPPQPGEPEHAGQPGGHSLWYTWSATFTGTVSAKTCGSEIDTLLGVYTGNAVDTLTPVASNDDGPTCGPQSELQFSATAGVLYRIAVDGKSGAEGNLRLQLEKAPPAPKQPANDDFLLPTPLSGQNAESDGLASNVLATKQAGEPDHAGNFGGSSVWFSWTAPASGTLTADTCESGFDTLLAVYTGSGIGGLTPVAADDDSTECGLVFTASATRSSVAFDVTSGTTYKIAVDGYDGATGNVRLYLHLKEGKFVPPTPPPTPPVVIDQPPTTKLPKCARGKVRKQGRCVRKAPHTCPNGKIRKHHKCVVPPPKCRKNQILKHGRCVRKPHREVLRRRRY